MDKCSLVFLGFNNMLTHKRGVENVIHFQLLASPFYNSYYMHWDSETRVSKFENLICIGVKKNLFWFITLNFLLFKLKKRRKKLFIHSHNPLMSIMNIYQTNLLTVHDALYYQANVTKHKFNKAFWFLEKILYLRSKHVHFISDYTKKMSLFSSNKNFVIIPNTSHFEIFKVKKTQQNNDIRIPFCDDLAKVFTVRSIEERARIDLMIEVAEKLKDENIQFFVAGKGPLLDFFKIKIKSLGLNNIILLGYVSDDDLIQYYKECDLVLVPAQHGEGFGLPIIEGYLFDKPVISSNVCAIPNVIISKEFLFENTVESIVSKLNFCMKQKGIEYRKYYDKRFSNQVIIKKMKKLYQEIN